MDAYWPGIKKFVRLNSATLLLLLFCFLLALFIGVTTGKYFDIVNTFNILEANSFRMLLAIGMMLVIASGAIDLSIGSVLSLSAMILAVSLHAGLPVWLCIVVGLLAGTILGIVNGAIISITKINAFIITLGTAFLFRGLSLIISRGTPVTRLPEAFRSFGSGEVLGLEAGVFYAVAAVFIAYVIFYKMKWGHYVSSLGGNAAALRRCGVKISRYRISVFAVSGFLAALAGMIITARLNSAEANAGLNMEMDAICAVVMGGTVLYGGKGNVIGTVIAVFLLGMIRNSLTLLSISSYYQQFITGAILLLAVIVAEYRERKKRVA